MAELLEAAGHTDFRDARGPMGFTQRQAGGKFTRDEADTFIDQLRTEADEGPTPELPADSGPPANKTKKTTPTKRSTKAAAPAAAGGRAALTPAEKQLRRIPTPELAAELQRRGWIVVEP